MKTSTIKRLTTFIWCKTKCYGKYASYMLPSMSKHGYMWARCQRKWRTWNQKFLKFFFFFFTASAPKGFLYTEFMNGGRVEKNQYCGLQMRRFRITTFAFQGNRWKLHSFGVLFCSMGQLIFSKLILRLVSWKWVEGLLLKVQAELPRAQNDCGLPEF